MSLILDALKRAERERGAQAALGLPELSPVPLGEPASARWPWLVGAIVLAGAVAWYWRKPAPVAAPIAAAPIPAPQTVPAKPAAVVAASPTPIAGTENLESLDDVTQPEDSVPAPAPVSAPAPAVAPEPVPVVAEPPAAPVPAPAPPVTAVVRDATPVKLMDTAPAYRAEFPRLQIQVHNWDRDTPASSFVRIAGFRYVAGETLAEGPKLIEIVNEGLVLDWNGQRVIYPLN